MFPHFILTITFRKDIIIIFYLQMEELRLRGEVASSVLNSDLLPSGSGLTCCPGWILKEAG